MLIINSYEPKYVFICLIPLKIKIYIYIFTQFFTQSRLSEFVRIKIFIYRMYLYRNLILKYLISI